MPEPTFERRFVTDWTISPGAIHPKMARARHAAGPDTRIWWTCGRAIYRGLMWCHFGAHPCSRASEHRAGGHPRTSSSRTPPYTSARHS